MVVAMPLKSAVQQGHFDAAELLINAKVPIMFDGYVHNKLFFV